MPRPPAAADRVMDLHVAIREARRAAAPVWEQAIASGDYALMSETHVLADLLRICERQAKRVAGLADQVTCADGLVGPNHGAAA